MGRLGMMPGTGETAAVELRPSGTTPPCPHCDTPVLLVARYPHTWHNQAEERIDGRTETCRLTAQEADLATCPLQPAEPPAPWPLAAWPLAAGSRSRRRPPSIGTMTRKMPPPAVWASAADPAGHHPHPEDREAHHPERLDHRGHGERVLRLLRCSVLTCSQLPCGAMGSAGTVAELVQRQWGDHRPGLRSEDAVLSHHQVASGAAARAALLADLLPHGQRTAPRGADGQHP